MASGTVPGSGNFCVLTNLPVAEVVAHLSAQAVENLDGPGERIGARGRILSVYFKGPDGNLVEATNQR